MKHGSAFFIERNTFPKFIGRLLLLFRRSILVLVVVLSASNSGNNQHTTKATRASRHKSRSDIWGSKCIEVGENFKGNRVDAKRQKLKRERCEKRL